MNKVITNFLSIVVSVLIFLSSSISSDITSDRFCAKAISYRTTYTIFGDLNEDDEIDVFDVVLMRKAISDGEYYRIADLNCDQKISSEDLELLSDYVLGKTSIIDAYIYEDEDEDGICDVIEVSFLKTNPDSKDTDSDELSDYEEIIYTKTSPTDKYTKSPSVSDANYDSDGDKLTNKDEINLQTNPQLKDSDSDGIYDYDEVNKYHTNPNDNDSDDDNIIDGDELSLGLDPSKNKTNGTVFDYQRVFNHSISASNSLISHINNDSPYDVSIDISSAGNVEKALSVEIGKFSQEGDNEKVIGKSLSFAYDSKLGFDSAKIYFKPKNSDLNIENYMIFKFFPENNYLLPLETLYTKDSAYIETSELGTFCLVDISSFIEPSGNFSKTTGIKILADDSSYSNLLPIDYDLGKTEVAFLIDTSELLNGSIEDIKTSIIDFSQALFEHSDDVVLKIIGYYYSTNDLFDSNFKFFKDNNGNSELATISSVNEAVEQISAYSSSKDNDMSPAIVRLKEQIANNLYSKNCENKYAFIVCDSTYTFESDLGFRLAVLNDVKNALKSIYNSNVKLNFLISSDCYNTSGCKNLKKTCNSYDFGVYKKSNYGYFADTAYSEIYSDIIADLQSLPIMYTCSVNPNIIPENVERNAFINSLPSSADVSKVPVSDSDGNINFKEAVLKLGLAQKDENGNPLFETLFSACDISELTRKGYKQLMKDKRISTRLIESSIKVTPFNNTILYADSDGDGIPNINDPYPNKPFDDRFEIIEDYNYEPSIDFVNTRYENSQRCYNSGNSGINEYIDVPHPAKWISYATLVAFYDSELLLKLLKSSVCSYRVDFGSHQERKNDPETLENACNAIMHYFGGTGKEVVYSQSDTCQLISSSTSNLSHLFDNINSVIRCAEEVTSDGNTVIICPKSNQKFKAICFSGTKEASDAVKCDIDSDSIGIKLHRFNEYCNYVHRDWQITIGEAAGTVIAKIERSGNKFIMQYRYYFKDIYEWAFHYDKDMTDVSAILHAAHETGNAQEYLMQGYYEGYISWNLNDKITDKEIAQQIFMTLADKEGGLSDPPSYKWTNSNEIDRFKQAFIVGEY